MIRVNHTAALLLCILLPAAARAQEPRSDTLPAVALDTLTATILRGPVSLLRAPIAVSVVTEPALGRARAGLALEEALRGVPGVQVDNRFNYALGERISVRGFGARAQFGVRGVRVIVDGIPATLPDGQTTLNHVDPLDLARAEVIRGPAGALYGNAAGGVILLETPEPPAAPLATTAGVAAGGDGLLRLRGSAGGSSGAWEYRASATRLRYDGFREFSEAENRVGSARVEWRGRRDRVRVVLHGASYDAQNPGSLSDSLLRLDRRQAFGFNVRQGTGERGRHGELGGRWEHRAGGGTLQVSAYGVAREVDNPIPPAIIDLRRRAGGARASWSAALPGAPALRYTLGTELDAQRDRRENYANEQGERGALQLDQRERVTALGAFAQVAGPLGEGVELLAALRADRFGFGVDDQLHPTPANPDDSGSRPALGALSPSLGASWRAAPGLAVYANVATAFETPTTTELANRPDGVGGLNPDLQPQRTTSWEAGAKGQIGTRGRWGTAAYHARVRDALIPFEVAGQHGRQFFRNAGSTTHRGVEAYGEWVPTSALRARLAYTWTDARFRRYVVGGDTLDGNRVPGVAPHRLDARLAWGGATGAFAEVDARFVAPIPVDDRNRSESAAYTVADLRAGWTGVRLGGVRTTPFVGISNLFDRRYNSSVVVNAFGGRFFEPGPARTLYVGVEAAFGP